MASLKNLAIARRGEVLLFDPDEIKELPGYNVRDMESEETQAHIRRMADSIKATGVKSFPPITVAQKNNEIIVYSGHCRRRAFSLAKAEGAPIKGIAATINTQNEEERTLDLINSNEGLPLTPLEKASAVNRLNNFDWTTKEIAEKMGVTVQTVYNLLTLVSSPKDVKEMIKKGEVSATTAINSLKKDKEEAPSMLKEAVKEAKKNGKKKATMKKMVCCPNCNHKFKLKKGKEK